MFPNHNLLAFTLSLTIAAWLAAPASAQDPFDDPEVEIEETPTGPEVEIEDADRVEVDPTPDGGVRIEVEEEEPVYETEQVAIRPRIDFMLDFPHTRHEVLQNRINSDGFIDNRHEWAALWVLCKGREPLPKVDFTRELVVYYLNGLSDDEIPAVAFVTDGDLSLQESRFRGPFRPREYFAPLHVQVIPRQGMVRFVNGRQSMLIPGGYLMEPANPAEPLQEQPGVELEIEPAQPEPADDLFGR